MECNNTTYNLDDIHKRIEVILKKESDLSLPHYAEVAVLAVKIHNGDWDETWKDSAFSKVYECFITECLNVLGANKWCLNVYVASSIVWGVYDCDTDEKADSVVVTAKEIKTVVDILNESFSSKGYDKISYGIGVEKGDGLMINSNYSFCVDDNIVWGGGNTRKAYKLSGVAGKDNYPSVAAGEDFYSRLSDEFKKLFFMNFCEKANNRRIYSASLEDLNI